MQVGSSNKRSGSLENGNVFCFFFFFFFFLFFFFFFAWFFYAIVLKLGIS